MSASPHRSRWATVGDLVKLGTRLGALIVSAPRTTVYGAASSTDFAITATPTAPASGISVRVEYPASGKVRWEVSGFFWATSGTTFGTDVYAWVYNGATSRGGGRIALASNSTGNYRFAQVMTGTPGTSETVTLNLSAASNGGANFNTNKPAGIYAMLSATPLAG